METFRILISDGSLHDCSVQMSFCPRDRGNCYRKVSVDLYVCLSVCPSQSGLVSKRVNW